MIQKVTRLSSVRFREIAYFLEIFAFLLLARPALSATLYISPTGVNGAACGTAVSPCGTFDYVFSNRMSGGDTLIVKDGTYLQRIRTSAAISGIPTAYTIIKAEHDGMAIISDGTSGFDPVVFIIGSYIRFEGFKVISTAVGGSLQSALSIPNDSHHNKIMRSGFVVTPCNTGNHACENRANVDVSGHDNLLEDCWTWGGGRYKFIVFGGDDQVNGVNNVLRRCVVRHDREYSGGYNPQAAFANYQAKNTLFQNCLVIDSNQLSYYDGTAGVWKGAFWLEKGQKGGFVRIEGSIALNFGDTNDSTFIVDNSSGADSDPIYTSGNIFVQNSVAYGGSKGFYGWPEGHNNDRILSIEHSFIGNMTSKQLGDYDDVGGFSGGLSRNSTQSANAVSTNSIYYSIVADNGIGGNALFRVKGANNYNSFWGNHNNYEMGSTVGANDITNVNPLTASLLYPVRIEIGSPLKGAGSDGSDIGPTILKRLGVSGTLMGEPGYDAATSENLWPWPNEARIKADLSAYPSNWPPDGLPSPLRGFTTGNSRDGTPQTLTKYIWESFGHQIPADIYGGSGADVIAPVITAFTLPLTANNLTFSVTSFSASDAVGVTGYLITESATAPTAEAAGWQSSLPSTITATTAGTKTFYAWAKDAAGNISSGLSASVTLTLSAGKTYYVRPDGHNAASGLNNTNNTTTGAWLTLQYAANQVAAGDTVFVADGNYAGFMIQTAGTATSRIVFKALGTGANISSRNPTTADGINIESWTGTENADYITIDGFNVFNQPRMGIRAIAGTGIIIQNCTSRNNASNGIFSGDTPNIQVLNNRAYLNGTGSMEHNIYISNALSDNPIVRGNVIYDANAGNGLQLNGDWEMGGDGFIDNAVVENNIVYSNASKGLSLISVRNGRFQNNIVYNNGPAAGGIHLVDQLGQNFSTGNVVTHNTIDEPNQASIRVNTGSTNNIIFNNISIGSTGIIFEGTGNYQSNNYSSTGGAGIFINYAAHDYHLAAGSPAINFGLSTYRSVTPPAVDIESGARPQNGLFDVGAYEVGTAPAQDTTKPSVSVTAPASGSTARGVVTITASASDNIAVTRVEFFVDGILSGTKNAAPWTTSWDSAAHLNKTYSLTAKAFDAAGNFQASSPVSIIVNRKPSPPTGLRAERR